MICTEVTNEEKQLVGDRDTSLQGGVVDMRESDVHTETRHGMQMTLCALEGSIYIALERRELLGTVN